MFTLNQVRECYLRSFVIGELEAWLTILAVYRIGQRDLSKEDKASIKLVALRAHMTSSLQSRIMENAQA